MAWPSYYTNNFCPNPSIEVSTAGYSAILGTEQLAQVGVAHSGQSGLQVSTPGNVPGEGVSTPVGTIVASVTGSASVYIYGETGILTVNAVQNPGGQILGAMQVQLDGQRWQRVELDGLGMTANDSFSLLIYTTTAQALTFTVDAVQYEPESPAHPYVDGGSQYGTWTGTPGLSTSYQQYQFPVSANGGMVLEGTISVVAHGEVFTVALIEGQMDMSGQQHPMVATTEMVNGSIRPVIAPAIDTGVLGLPWEIAGGGSITSIVVLNPGSGFSDFGIWATGVDPDPAMTLIGYNNAGTQDAASASTSYARIFGTFSPPQQALDSQGGALWQSAAYMAAGFRIASQAPWAAGSPNAVNFTQVQVEQVPNSGSGPSAYQLPRALLTIVKPSRMNYVTNPSMEISIAGWTAIGGATVTQFAGGVEGNFSLEVSVPAAGGGVYIVVPDLILGDTFAASGYAAAVSTNINDITMAIGSAQTSAAATGLPYGAGSYGSGPYGGVQNPATPLPTSGVYRPFTPFVATQSALALSFVPVAITGATYPLVFQIDGVLVEPGEVLNPYGDGSTDGWQWELGGTPGLCRSYYYERESVAANAVQSVLDQHIPLGISAYAPQYAVPPTQ